MISFSQASTLANCEMQWYYKYVDKIGRDSTSAPRVLGKIVQEAANAFWRKDDWEETILSYDASDEDTPFLADASDLSFWLMGRYAEKWAFMRESVTVIDQELDLTMLLPSGTEFRGIIDEVWSIDGETWLVERKTYGRNTRLASIDVDLQIGMYVALLNEHTGEMPTGVIWDGIYTYRWKDLSKKTLDDTCKMIYTDRTTEQIAVAIDAVERSVARSNTIRDNKSLALRNIGSTCNYCDSRDTCWNEMLVPSLEIVE